MNRREVTITLTREQLNSLRAGEAVELVNPEEGERVVVTDEGYVFIESDLERE